MSIKKLCFILTAIFLASLIIALCIMGGTSDFTPKTNEMTDSKTISSEGVLKLNLEAHEGAINLINAPEGSDYKIEVLSGTDNRYDVTTTKDGDTINIDISSKKLFLINFGFSDPKINIYVPTNKELVIDATCSSSLDMKSIVGNELNINSVSGFIKIENCSFNSASIDSVSGMCNIEGLSGDIEIGKVSGSLKINDINGKFGLGSTSGSCSLDFNELKSDINIKSVSGMLNISLPADTSFLLNTDSASGMVRNDFETVKNSKYLINVNKVSGSLNIKEKK